MKKLILLLFSLFMVAESAGIGLNPISPVSNICANVLPTKKVFVRVVLLRFCDLPPNIQNTYRSVATKASLKRTLTAWGNHLKRKFDWNVRMEVTHKFSCAPPYYANGNVLSYEGKADGRENVLQINLVFKPIGSALVYARWVNNARADITANVANIKPVSMITFVLHQQTKHNLASTQLLHRRVSQDAILPNKYYHMEGVEDLKHNFQALSNTKYLPILSIGFSCNPAFIGALPYQYMVGNNHKCICQCPVGYHFVNIHKTHLKKCVPDKDPNHGACEKLNKCYSFSVQELTGQKIGTCKLKAFSKIGLPCPWDNYVAYHRNPPPSGTAPRIVVTLKTSTTSQQVIFTWQHLQKDFASLLDKMFTFKTAGIHNLEMRSYDFDKVAVCRTQIRITDNILPVSEGSCPILTSKSIRFNSNAAVENVNVFISDFKAFKSLAIYGQCQKGTIQSTEFYTGWCLNKVTPCFHVTSSSTVNLKKRLDDERHLQEIAKTIGSSIPGNPKDKCLAFKSTLKERTTIINCSQSTHTTLNGAECNPRRCYTFVGSDLYTAEASINAGTQKKTQTLMDILEPGFNRAEREIHEKIPQFEVGTQKRDLSKYFETKLGTTAFGLANFDAKVTMSYYQSILRCRYKVPESKTSSSWQTWSWTGKNEVLLSQEVNTIMFECWTSLGRVHKSEFQLVIHPTINLDVCPSFIQSSFYQSLTDSSSSSEFCNVRDSAFAELTFHFNSWVGREKKSHLKSSFLFWDITCLARYDHGNGVVQDFSGDPATILKDFGPRRDLPPGQVEPTTQFIKHYGVDLRKSPTTMATTRVRFDCRLRYKDRANNQFTVQNCEHTIAFRDCDKPEYPGTDCEDLENCYTSCGSNTKPFQYCGPNLMTFEDKESITGDEKTILKDISAVPCCSTPSCTKYYGTSFTCNRLGADDQVKRCEPVKPQYLMALLQQGHEDPLVMSGVFISAFIIVALFVRNLRVEETLDIDRQHYHELLY